MALLEVKNLKKEFDGKILFDNLSFNLNIEDKMGLIGSNGAGKTTLLKIILDEIPRDDGSIHLQSGKTIGYLSQVMIHSFENTLMEEMLISFKDVIELEHQLNDLMNEMSLHPEDESLLKKYGNVETKFINRGGYDYHYLIDLMISKFGFSSEDYDRKIGSFSGGERNKIAFTKLLLSHPDILILDEPTNHLDVETIEWLEEYLHNYDGAVIIVSHDRYFIDNVCNCILEISNNTAEYYRGNYSYYLQEKVQRFERRLQEYNLQEKEIEHLKTLIARFKPKPTKVGLAKDREKKLARIMENKLDRPKEYNPQVHFNIKAMDLGRVKQITLDELTFGYNNNPLTNPLNITIFYGEKVGIIGNNGTGKTTLLKTIGEFYQPIGGKVHKHRKLNVGYIDQNQIQIDSELTVFDYFHSHYESLTNYEIRHHLGSFLFQQDDVFKTVNELSGGEKVRLSFALLVLKKYDILLLDEPTNHLDIETRKVLESALSDYQGTIIFVSHDRYFIESLATRLITFKNGEVSVFEGDYQSYIDDSKKKQNLKKEPVEIKKEESSEKPAKPKKPKKVNIKKLEENIAKLEEELEHLNSLLEEEEYYTNRPKMEALEDEIMTKENELRHLEDEYLENME